MGEPDGRETRLRVGHVPGVTTTKWRRIWAERFPRTPLEIVEVDQAVQRRGLDRDERDPDRLDLCFVREPVARDGLHLIPLYEEVAVVVARKDHPIAVFDAVALAELADEDVIEPAQPDAVDLVAGGAGVMFVPQSIAREQSRRDLVYRPVSDAPPTRIGLAWRVGDENPLVEDFIGIVRGRTVNSSRSRTPGGDERTPPTSAPGSAPARTASGGKSSPTRSRRRPPKRRR